MRRLDSPVETRQSKRWETGQWLWRQDGAWYKGNHFGAHNPRFCLSMRCNS